jgi:hypothetical protein
MVRLLLVLLDIVQELAGIQFALVFGLVMLKQAGLGRKQLKGCLLNRIFFLTALLFGE